MVAAEITLFIPGAGPPPTRIAQHLRLLISLSSIKTKTIAFGKTIIFFHLLSIVPAIFEN
jgi:hypothetical protein